MGAEVNGHGDDNDNDSGERDQNVISFSKRTGRVGPQGGNVPPVAGLSDARVAVRQERPVLLVALDDIQIGGRQLREVQHDPELDELADSIRSKGILQPLLVRPLDTTIEHDQYGTPNRQRYELVAGERRLRAARTAGLSVVPILVQELSDQESVEIAIIENAQRQDLNPIDESLAYRRLAQEFGLSHSEIARAVGKSRVAISNSMRLLQLEPEVVELVRSGALSAGHGRALLVLKDPREQLRLAQRAIQRSWSVRDLEQAASEQTGKAEREEEGDQRELQALERLQSRVSEYLGLERVHMRVDSSGRKRLSLTFDTEASWKRFISKIKD
jgi:ParB family transcriptional regulator, chromosome partitioning protein